MKTLQLIINGQCRSGKNNLIVTRSGHRFPRPEWAKWRDDVIDQLRNQMPPDFVPFLGDVAATITYHPGDKRRRDVPGLLDALLHCIERVQIVKDDVQIRDVFWYTKNKAHYPGLEITLIEKENK